MTYETDTTSEAHDELQAHAQFIVGHVLPGMAETYGLCLTCLGHAVIAEIEAALACVETHEEPEDTVGAPEGNA